MTSSGTRNPFRRLVKWFIGLLGGVVLLAAIGIALLFVPQTRVMMLQSVLDNLHPDLEIVAKKIRSPALGRWTIKAFQVDLREQKWIAGRNLVLDFSVADLFNKTLTINEFTLQELQWHHPEDGLSQGSDSQESGGAIAFPNWALDLQKLQIPELELYLGTLPLPEKLQQSSYSLQANASLVGAGEPLRLNLKLQGLDNSLKAEIETAAIQNDVTLLAQLSEDKGGLFASLLAWPSDEALALDIELAVEAGEDKWKLALRKAQSRLKNIPLNLQAEVQIARSLDQMTIDKARLQTGEQQHSITGQLAAGASDLLIDLQGFPLDLLAPWLDQLDGGVLTGKTQLTGEIARPKIDTELKGRAALKIDGWSPDLHFDTALYFDWQKLTVHRLQVSESQGAIESLQASGAWSFDDKALQLQLSAQGLHEEVLQRVQSLLTFIPDAAQLTRLQHIELALDGNLNNTSQLQLDLDAAGSARYRTQTFLVEADIEGSPALLNIAQFVIQQENGNLNANGVLDLQGAKNDLTINVREFPLELLRAMEVNLPDRLHGIVNGNAILSNTLASPDLAFDADANLRYNVVVGFEQDKLEQMQFAAKGEWKESLLDLQKLTLDVVGEDGKMVPLLRADADIALGEKRFKLNASTREFPMALLANYGWPDSNGMMNLDLQVQAPLGDFSGGKWLQQLTAEGQLLYKTTQTDRRTGRPVKLEVTMDLNNETESDNGKSWWHAKLSMRQGQQSSKTLSLRSETSEIGNFVKNFNQLPRTRVNGELDFAFFNFLLRQTQHVGGVMKADLWVDGELPRPQLEGSIAIEDGSMVLDAYGLRLGNLQMLAEFSGREMQLASLSATDMGGGELTGSGRVSWREGLEKGEIDLQLQAKNFEAIRHEQIEGKANAELNLVGDFEKVILRGDINLTPFSVSIAQKPGSEVPQLNYEFRHEEDEEQEEALFSLPELVLDIKITVDKQAFVRGRGLEAELAGTVGLTGPLDDIEYRGEFNTVRGQFTVMGKRFVLQKGELRFSNNALAIYVRGVYQERDLRIIAELRGANEKFSIDLSSTPEMPDDELLARLIFGRSVANISAIQAVQIAQAVKTLKGDGGFDPLEKAREALNVDTLKLDTDKTESGQSVSLGAGKYITDRVFLELERSSDPANPWQGNVLIELTQHISLESSTGGSAGSSAEILWKYDY